MRDEDRYLTDQGREDARRVGERLADLGFRASHVFTSPLVRAVQTSELVARAHGSATVRVHEPLAIDEGSADQAIGILESLATDATVFLVTHEPKIRTMAAKLARQPSFGGFPTAGVAVFEGRPGSFALRGQMDPSELALRGVDG